MSAFSLHACCWCLSSSRRKRHHYSLLFFCYVLLYYHLSIRIFSIWWENYLIDDDIIESDDSFYFTEKKNEWSCLGLFFKIKERKKNIRENVSRFFKYFLKYNQQMYIQFFRLIFHWFRRIIQWKNLSFHLLFFV